MRAKKISLTHAKPEKLFYFVANVVIYRAKDRRCLILKRDEREKVHPGKWAVPGGKLEWKDLPVKHPTRVNGDVLDYENKVEDLLAREALEEANVKIKGPLKYINSVAFIRPDETPVILVKFAAQYLSGNVVPEKGGFTDLAWVNAKEVKEYRCIKGVDKEVKQTIKLFS
ncbi:MAG: NUDIX hydrolase [Candidatus Paceibacterota bacterium]|jgi:ADP-ribose pyrophosphatase YjhB (NUDIX family)